jgi:CPA2 family monovalent cation:H+ antiporter-2
MHFSILEVILIVFVTALTVSILFRKLKLSVVLGYLAVGALLGPHALGFVQNSNYVNSLADFGVVFLMFTVGLEFSIPKLFALRNAVFFVGGLQVAACVGVTTGIGMLLGMSMAAALVTGCIVAMSSTALVVKQLHDQYELQTHHGLNAIGVLLFQDIAVIPLIILITGLARGSEETVALTLLWALGKGLVAISLIFIVGRWLLRPLFHAIAKTRAIELFTLSVLLVTLTGAWVTEILGLSYAFGAFLAGMMLGETEYRHQIEVEIRPFRDILLALFFITVGMLADFTTWKTTWGWILLLVTTLTLGKIILISILSRFSGTSTKIALRTGIVLAQGGEFGFAILDLAMDNRILTPFYQQIILASLLISIAIAPILIRFNRQLAELFSPPGNKLTSSINQHKIIGNAKKMNQQVIICGYGRVGQHLARMLDKIHFPYIAIDLDADLVQQASLAGDEVIYGDASHPEILQKAGVEHAKVLIISLSDHRAAVKVLTLVRSHYPDLPVLVRCRDKNDLKQLKKIGATQIIAELFEVSLTLSHHLLQIIKLPRDKIAEIIQDVRNTDYDLLQKVFVGNMPDESYAESDPLSLHEQLCPIVISDAAYAVNRKLNELQLKELGVEVISIRRGNEKHVKPHGNVKILVDDIVVLFGTYSNLEDAERRLLEG